MHSAPLSATNHGRGQESRRRRQRRLKVRRRRVVDLQAKVVQHLLDILREKDISAAELARRLQERAPWMNASSPKLSRWFTTSREPGSFQEMGIREIDEISKALGVTVAELLYGPTAKGRPPTELERARPTREELIRALAEIEGLEVRRPKSRRSRTTV
jgi:hypothetical protein